MKTIEEIRKAFLAMHHYATKENAPTYMSVPADRERDADLILSDAIDELEKLRANENATCWAALGEIEGLLGISGSVPVTTAARAIEKLKADLIAAKADAARLREELISARERICEIGVGEESDSPVVAKRLLGQSEDALGAIDAALSATDSGAWLRGLLFEAARLGEGEDMHRPDREIEELIDEVLRGAP